MKYKVGDKFLIEITEINERCIFPYNLGNGILMTEEWVSELCRPDDMTVEEAWEIAKKIAYLYFQDPNEEFSGIYTSSYDLLTELSPQEAKTKIEAWEAEKAIKVGDVVRNVGMSDIEVVITKRYKDGTYDGINPSGAVHSGMNDKNWEKTGRHIDIQGVLDRIGGAE